ncbi:hypothetical protein ACIP88_36185 [Streptomyces uncialis]|uniref:hypothetical protein n=1 Tax=Streptomyces uncialis TaxID=1048205 RepID=UPI00382FAD60
MRAIRLASATVLTLTALAATALVASAEDRGSEEERGSGHGRFEADATPSTIAAGGRLTLHANGCDGDTRVSSGVFDTVHIRKGDRSRSATVDWDARHGAVYTVTFTCERESSRTVELTIAGGGSGGDHEREPGHDRESGHEQARRGVRAGLGGTLAGFDPEKVALGAALVAGAIGTAYYRTRRRTGDDGS